MLVNYSQVPKDKRDAVRSVNEKGHVAYIIAMMLRRKPLKEIPGDLIKLNLTSNTVGQFKSFFDYALFPVIKEAGLEKYYKKYKDGIDVGGLTVRETFIHSEDDRLSFVKDVVVPTGTAIFFSEEVRSFYGFGGLPKLDDGSPIIDSYSVEWQDIIVHDRRHVIDNFLSEGRKPKQIVEYFQQIYNEILSEQGLTSYLEGFMNAQLYDISRLIEQLDQQVADINATIIAIKDSTDMSLGEKTVRIKGLKNTERELRGKLKKMKSLHNSGAFGAATLEYANMRDILADILQRTHRRFVMMDSRTDDEVVSSLSQLVTMVTKTNAQIIHLDEVASGVETKSITEEMIEVTLPTLDRIEQEETEAIRRFNEIIDRNIGSETEAVAEGKPSIEDILGMG